MSAYAESTHYLYELVDVQHYLLYAKNLNNTLMKPTDVGMSNLFLIVKSKYTE